MRKVGNSALLQIAEEKHYAEYRVIYHNVVLVVDVGGINLEGFASRSRHTSI